MGSSNSSNGGITLTGALFLLFLGLKLGGIITWSWWWVTSPLWLPAAIILPILLITVIAAKIYDSY